VPSGRLEGVSVEAGQKGVVVGGATHGLIHGLFVHGVGDNAFHLRSLSSHNLIRAITGKETGQNELAFSCIRLTVLVVGPGRALGGLVRRLSSP